MVSLFGRGFDSHQLHLLLPPAGHSIIPLPPRLWPATFFYLNGDASNYFFNIRFS